MGVALSRRSGRIRKGGRISEAGGSAERHNRGKPEGGMQFEWDEAKNRRNKAKHGVSFEVAARVFADPLRIERHDVEHSVEEDRWLTIGMVYPAILVVIYTERQPGNRYRIISARHANEKERQIYCQF